MAGYLVLMPSQGCKPTCQEVAEALHGLGLKLWDGNGNPEFVVFHNAGPKGDYFEAGYWGGRGVMVFFLGGSQRCTSRKQIVNRFKGWTVIGADNRAELSALVAAVQRWRGVEARREDRKSGKLPADLA